MSMTARPYPSSARPRRSVMAAMVLLAIVLAACGGGGGGGGNGDGNGSGYMLRVAVTNEVRSGPVDASLDTDLEPGEATSIDSCSAKVLELAIPLDDWRLVVNGQTAIDSTQMDPNLIDRNLIAEVVANDDGTVTQKSLAIGGGIGAPAQAGICL
jgi:hypothetical protein